MSYDTSITKRKGCNYCLREKELLPNGDVRICIDDDDCNGKAFISFDAHSDSAYIDINYCPICGKELK